MLGGVEWGREGVRASSYEFGGDTFSAQETPLLSMLSTECQASPLLLLFVYRKHMLFLFFLLVGSNG